jgi:hypothetical protein
MNEPKRDFKLKRRWYDRNKDDDKWARFVSEDPWRQYIVDQLDELRHALIVRLGILFVIMVAGGIALFLVNQSANHAAHEAKKAATVSALASKRASTAVSVVQHQRYQANFDRCIAQNKAHGKTIDYLNELEIITAKQQGLKKGSPAYAALMAQFAPFFKIMDAAVPFNADCGTYATQATNGSAGGP